MNVKHWFNFKENKQGYRDAILSVLSIAILVKLGTYLYPDNFSALIFMILPAIFIPLTLMGESKLVQLGFALEHNLYNLLVIMLTIFILVHVKQYSLVYIALLIFLGTTLPRFRQGSMNASAFIAVYSVICVMLYNMQLVNETNYVVYLEQISQAYALAVIVVLLVVIVLPLTKIPIIPATTDNYQIIRAFRLSIAILLALVLSQIFHAYNSAWVCLAVIVVMKNSLGDTIARSSERLVATALGVACGLLFAHYLSSILAVFSFSALIFLFLGMLLISRNYTVGLFFFTILVACLFYLIKPGTVDINQYLWARLIDTFIGIVIALCCEIVILPRSSISQTRVSLCLMYRDLWFLMMMVKSPYAAKDLQELISDVKQRIHDVNVKITAIRYEPLILLKRRYKFFVGFAEKLSLLMISVERGAEKNQISLPVSDWVQQVFSIMRNVYKIDEATTKRALQKILHDFPSLFDTASKVEQEILTNTKKIIDVYISAFSVKPWFFW